MFLQRQSNVYLNQTPAKNMYYKKYQLQYYEDNRYILKIFLIA